MEAEPVVRRRRTQDSASNRTSKGSGGAKSKSSKSTATKSTASKPKASKPKANKAKGTKAAAPAKPASSGVGTYLARPNTTGPKVRLGILWFLAAVGVLVLGRWAVLALWGCTAMLAAWQTTRAWRDAPHTRDLPSWAPLGSAAAAGLCVAASGVGTSLGGAALMVVPIVLVVLVVATGRKPAAAGAAVIGVVLASVPAMSVVLVARTEVWAALFLVVAVSFYDAGYFFGAAESSSRLEGPVTGAIGLLGVTFTASAFEAQPFDRATAWVAGAVMLFACPLGQVLTSAELPTPDTEVPALRRLDSYLVAAPLMLAAVWVFT